MFGGEQQLHLLLKVVGLDRQHYYYYYCYNFHHHHTSIEEHTLLLLYLRDMTYSSPE